MGLFDPTAEGQTEERFFGSYVYSLIPVIGTVKAGYGGEWASNFHTGDTSAHTGFVTPVAAVFASLKAYLARAGQGGTFKLWLGGYSRGSIIANLLAARIARELPQLGRENIYAYGFAVPAALTAADRPDLQQDFDANHAPDGTLLENWPESNIFSIISSGDAVARVLPAAWGYHRNGCDRFLPATRNAEELADLDALGADSTNPSLPENALRLC